MIGVLFGKAGRMLCGMKSDEKITPEAERLAAVLGSMFLLALMAGVTVLSLWRMERINLVDMIVMLLAVFTPWVVFDFFIKPSSQWLSSDGSK
jgi:hypothetical protein